MIIAQYSDSKVFFSTPTWQEVYGYFDIMKSSSLGKHVFGSHCVVNIEESPKSAYAIGCHKHCVIQYVLEGTYSVFCAPGGMLDQHKVYNQETDENLFIKGDMQEYIMQAGQMIILSPKEAYMPNSKEANKVATCMVPYYLLLDSKEHIEISCFSLIHRFMPETPKKYPILECWTVNNVIDSLGIDREVVRVVFIDDKAVSKDTEVKDGMRVSLFPGIGGG